MSTNQQIENRAPGGAERATGEKSNRREEIRSNERSLLPAIDIFEDAQQLSVQADMPGVSKETLNVQVDQNSLLIEGTIAIDMPGGMSAIYADLQTTKYRRTFSLSKELETERISANLSDGVLTVRIPKRAEFRTRKIQVNVG